MTKHDLLLSAAKEKTVGLTDEMLGLYRKYDVRRLKDADGKHANCEYYVLDLVHDKFSAAALEAYSTACKDEFPQLAYDLQLKSGSVRVLHGLPAKDQVIHYGKETPETHYMPSAKDYGPTDLDLAPAFRTQANLWQAKYFEMLHTMRGAHKGIRRLQRKLAAKEIAAAQTGNSTSELGATTLLTAATHADHPLRHFDRTCPACNEEAAAPTIEGTLSCEPTKFQTELPLPTTPTLAQRLRIDQHDSSFGACIRERIEAADVIERLERELAQAQETNKEWLAENAPGGWIDNIRAELAESNAKCKAAATVTGNMMSEYAEMRDALAEARKAGFKLTAALCALPEDDSEKISRPRVMELVAAWRSTIDAAMKEQKK